MRRLNTWMRLEREQRRLLVMAAVTLGAVRAAMRVVPFRVLRSVAAALPQAKKRAQGQVIPSQVGWALKVAAHKMPGTSTCLARALAAQMMLRRAGYEPKLRLGVARKEHHAVEAHAWLECEGRVVVGDGEDLSRFAAFPMS